MPLYVEDDLNGTPGVQLTLGPDWDDLETDSTFRYNGLGTGVDLTDFSHDAAIVRTGNFLADQFVEIVVSGISGGSGSAGIGFCLRGSGFDTTRTYYRVVANESNIELAKFVNGTYTQLATNGGLTMADGDIVRGEIKGNKIRIYRNGVQLGTETTDSDIATGKPGLAFSSGAVLDANVDSFKAGDLPWTKVQSNHADNPSGGTPVAFPINVTAGNLLIAEVGSDSSGMSVSDSTGHNIWNQVRLQPDDASDQIIALWWTIAQQSEALSVIPDYSSGAFRTLIIQEWSNGGIGDISLDKQDGIGAFATDAVTPSITPNADFALLISLAYSNGSVLSSGNEVDFPFQFEDKANDSAEECGMNSYTQPVAASINSTINFASGPNNTCSIIASFITIGATPPAGDAGPTLIRVFANRQNW